MLLNFSSVTGYRRQHCWIENWRTLLASNFMVLIEIPSPIWIVVVIRVLPLGGYFFIEICDCYWEFLRKCLCEITAVCLYCRRRLSPFRSVLKQISNFTLKICGCNDSFTNPQNYSKIGVVHAGLHKNIGTTCLTIFCAILNIYSSGSSAYFWMHSARRAHV